MQDKLQRWRSEKTAAYLSDAVAKAEPDPARAWPASVEDVGR
jgi:hypothetical protein